MTEKKTKHHHGDLRNALIQAGIAILAEDGIDKLTLRRCAARAGVSHAAPAHHFKGVEGLRGAIAEEGFVIFRGYMQRELDKVGDDPHRRLKAISLGYLLFALENPALFELIFGISAMLYLNEVQPESPGASYDMLRQCCAPFVAEGAESGPVEAQVWSLIHGFATLFLSEQFGPVDRGNPDLDAFNKVITLLDSLPLADRA
ncbi:hypothetical protein ACMU_14745 [Actibacterium mucosum KCTC 23349]|uniref:HTH tetR-type domain-containing protein n=1 Tax=Actibacterium mucosum KCTC 23349 TaxID=1454373 RepID=A0A037ZJM0_9RHOB|nr:TetR/AcrR family transcriptional regulator [Actibacterium mucosum]KAJ55011.1 hypothetical protein ACMU_14745 [Actibacterium mucosum KCTC 23349]